VLDPDDNHTSEDGPQLTVAGLDQAARPRHLAEAAPSPLAALHAVVLDDIKAKAQAIAQCVNALIADLEAASTREDETNAGC